MSTEYWAISPKPGGSNLRSVYSFEGFSLVVKGIDRIGIGMRQSNLLILRQVIHLLNYLYANSYMNKVRNFKQRDQTGYAKWFLLTCSHLAKIVSTTLVAKRGDNP